LQFREFWLSFRGTKLPFGGMWLRGGGIGMAQSVLQLPTSGCRLSKGGVALPPNGKASAPQQIDYDWVKAANLQQLPAAVAAEFANARPMVGSGTNDLLQASLIGPKRLLSTPQLGQGQLYTPFSSYEDSSYR
jgi:hypothetical protein